MLERLEILIGKNNVDKIKLKAVAVIGIGGVGGYVVESLVRSGIENITIIDYDKIDVTNKNRQIIELDSTIGMKKVDAFEQRIKNINNSCKVKKLDCFLDESNIDILNGYDYVIDSCDSVLTKFEIIKYCLNNNICFISCMGTGKRLNPSLLKITDLMKTEYDPLAKRLRKMVRDAKIKKKIPVVCSSEIPKKLDTNIIGSNSFVPATAGLLITSFVINDIIK